MKNYMFDLEQTNDFQFVPEVLRSEMNRRFIYYDLNFCENAFVDLIDLTVKITDLVVSKKPGILQEIKNCHRTKMIVIQSMNPLNMMLTICNQKKVVLVKLLILEICNPNLTFSVSCVLPYYILKVILKNNRIDLDKFIVVYRF